jgi:hypothetical protein
MQEQQKAEGELLGIYRSLIAVILLLVLLAIIGFRYFNLAPTLVGHSLALEHDKLQNVLVMVRSKWLSLGQPKQLHLDWLASGKGSQSSVLIDMSLRGFPLPPTPDDAGCAQLWQQLLGTQVQLKALRVEYRHKPAACSYTADNFQRIVYELERESVSFSSESR